MPAVAPVVAHLAATVPAVTAQGVTLATLKALSVAAFGHDLALQCQGGEAEQAAAITRAFYSEHVQIPGLSYAALEGVGVYRPTLASMATGRNMAGRAAKQAAIDKYFATAKPGQTGTANPAATLTGRDRHNAAFKIQ